MEEIVSEKAEIIQLKPDDWQRLRDLRLRALKEEPNAFGSSYSEGLERTEDLWRKSLENPWYFFAKEGESLVGMVSASREQYEKSRHVVDIFGVYVRPEARGKGAGKALLERLISEISKDETIVKIKLRVSNTQTAAQQMYKDLGFEVVGTHKKELLVDGQYLDEIEMVKFIR